MNDPGFVIIGRNEGARLALSIDSVQRETSLVVYVDSGSSDGSVSFAKARGLPVVELDPALPFTAARARNAGFGWLMRCHPELEFVHFIDGDCELVPGWLDRAMLAIRSDDRLAAVCGRRRERDPKASPYNGLCDHEWDTPIGLRETCGGDALFRTAPLRSVGGFREDLIAGEEPDLCHRIRKRGWLIRRIDADMTVHDAAMTRFSQWWQRNRRSGYATAEALALRGKGNRPLCKAAASNVLWALPPMWILWPLLWFRVCRRSGPMVACFITLGKIPHCQGQLQYWLRSSRRKAENGRTRLIEYK